MPLIHNISGNREAKNVNADIFTGTNMDLHFLKKWQFALEIAKGRHMYPLSLQQHSYSN